MTRMLNEMKFRPRINKIRTLCQKTTENFKEFKDDPAYKKEETSLQHKVLDEEDEDLMEFEELSQVDSSEYSEILPKEARQN